MRFGWYAVPPLPGFGLLAGLLVMVRRAGAGGGSPPRLRPSTAVPALWKLDILLLTLTTDHARILVNTVFPAGPRRHTPGVVNFVAAFLRDPPRRRLLAVFGAWSGVLGHFSRRPC